MMSVAEVWEEIRKLKNPCTGDMSNAEERAKFDAYMSRRRELAHLLWEAEQREEQEKRGQQEQHRNQEKQGEDMRQQVKALVDRKKTTIAKLATATGYSRPTISMYLAGNYKGDVEAVERRLEEYMKTQGWNEEKDSTSAVLPAPKTFYESRDARAIMGVCQSCQDYMGLGIVVGRSGYGKTHTLKRYAKMSKVAYIECDDTMSSRDLIEAIETALGIPSGYGTNWKRINGIRDFFNTNKGYLLIIDEADKLVSKYTSKKMEILRGIYDQADVGLVIAGEPALEAQIKTYLLRMANRVDFYASLSGLNAGEVKEYLEGYRIEDAALAELKARACNPQTGCFRLLDRTMRNVRRMMEAPDQTITLKMIEQASGMMML